MFKLMTMCFSRQSLLSKLPFAEQVALAENISCQHVYPKVLREVNAPFNKLAFCGAVLDDACTILPAHSPLNFVYLFLVPSLC
jgi:hypothetical protein